MSARKYRIKLTPEEQQELKGLVSHGRAAAYRQTHARIRLLSDEAQEGGAMPDGEIARVLQIGRPGWNGCAGAVLRKGLRRRCAGRSNCAAGRRNRMGRGKPA